jgi:triosephosphate isomerase
MARTKFIAGNWKMNTTKAAAVELATAIARGGTGGVTVGIAPPFVYLDAVFKAIEGTAVYLGAQDVCCEPNGAYTGEVSVAMLKDLGVRFCLNGHSERRHIVMESSALITKKANAIYAGGLTLVHCVGETLQERQADKTFAVIQSHLDELSDAIDDPSRLVVAYEPVWAIGTGHNATDAQAQEVHAYIRDAIAKKWNKDFADHIRIQYGGSMKPENARGLLSQPDVDGGLIGGAALKAETFLAIVGAAKA